MKKQLYFIFTIFISLFFCIQNISALNVYLGLEIINLTDNPGGGNCMGVSGAGYDYGSQGRMRAISSIIPSYPLYFNLSYFSNGTTVWSGDSTKDTDYGIGEIIYLPTSLNLNPGETYNLMMDIDAIRIYLPISNLGGFTETINDEYWTAGDVGTDWRNEYHVRSGIDDCIFFNTGNVRQDWLFFISRNRGTLSHSCMHDAANNNCDSLGYVGMRFDDFDFLIDSQYNNLHQDNIGNFNMQFTIS